MNQGRSQRLAKKLPQNENFATPHFYHLPPPPPQTVLAEALVRVRFVFQKIISPSYPEQPNCLMLVGIGDISHANKHNNFANSMQKNCYHR